MADRVKLALFGLHRGSSVDPDVLVRRARAAEDAGFEALWVGDHIALPASDEAAEQPRLEALIALTYLAAVTARVRLGVGVIVLPQRQPVLLAKQLTSIDVLSGGRLTVGIGVGYVEPELHALGTSLADRSARTDEFLAAMRSLWSEPAPAFAGRHVSFADVVQRPLPAQRPHPPIVVGGHSPAAFRRAVRSGNGWYGWRLDLEETRRALADLRETAARGDRPAELGELEITITPPRALDLDTALRYAELGVHRLAVQPETMEGAAIGELIATTGEGLIGRLG
jgi:probable F420-dependent oxidoreductase